MQTQLKIIMGCDLAAYDFKTQAIADLCRRGYTITDIGCHNSMEGEYPQIAEEAGKRVVSGEFDRGLLVCGTGQGMAMAANKVKGVRAALCYDIFPALLSREHNNSNILATGCWMITLEKYLEMVEVWLFGKFNGGRHETRIDYMLEMEKKV
ncbi:MAG: RpiB/LacA/LacB family sugar-phosphate isomerase [Treponema sp.]|nr:RpiB/LacA/LacB family sugar-phosphate isomerase [Treponema sp.]